MTRIALITLFIISIVTACTRPEDEPQFLGIDRVNVTDMNFKEAHLTAEARFFNPNSVKIKLKEVNVEIQLEGKAIGHIDQEFDLKIAPNSEFSVPLDATFKIQDIGMINGLMSILGGKKAKVKYKGYIKASVHGFTSTVPVEYDDEVKL